MIRHMDNDIRHNGKCKDKKLSMDELNRLSIDEYKTFPKYPVVLVLDNVRSLQNVGSVFRTADAFNVEKIYLCGITATPPHRDIHKTALGATESVQWEYFKETEAALVQLKEMKYTIIAVEQTEGSVYLQDLNINNESKIALIFGNEVKGVSNEVINLTDFCIEIPQFGTKHSLNVSVSAGIVTWEVIKKKGIN